MDHITRPTRWLGALAAAWPRLIAAMLGTAAVLACVMAILAPINDRPDLWRGPPDEHGHRGAARYYVDHWLPPKVGDPASLDSYSRDYGFSYINDPDPVYPLAGRFAALVSPIIANHDRAFRLFNAMLLAVLAAVCWLRPGAALAFAPLTLSPQVWYIFSYFNNDAFPLFVATLLAWQVVDPQSGFNRFVAGEGSRRGWGGAVAFIVLAALLALSKKNFLTVLALLPALIALRHLGLGAATLITATALLGATWYQNWYAIPMPTAAWFGSLALAATLGVILVRRGTRALRIVTLGRLALLGALSVAFMVPRFAWDAYQHGSLEEKRAAQGVLQEQIAKPEYKPSQIYAQREKSYYGIELRARGTPLSELFSPQWAWHKHTFFTGTASYGWIQFFSPPWFYHVIAAAYLAILAVYAFAVVRARSAAAVAGFALVAAFSALTIGIALFHSWNNDFQAQGRYLFPMIAMLGAGLFMVRDTLPRRTFAAIVTLCFALGVYSFVFTGLGQVPKSF